MTYRDPETGARPTPEASLPLFESGLSTLPLSGAQCETGGDLNPLNKPEIFAPVRDQAHARKSDPVHSHEAAASVVNIGPVRQGIVEILKEHGPQTDEAIKEIYRVREGTRLYSRASDESLRTRRSELVKLGFVIQDGEGTTVSGRRCARWRVK